MNGTTPTISGPNTFKIWGAGVPIAVVVGSDSSTPINVQLISAGTPLYSVEAAG